MQVEQVSSTRWQMSAGQGQYSSIYYCSILCGTAVDNAGLQRTRYQSARARDSGTFATPLPGCISQG